VAETDFDVLANELSTGDVARGVTAGITPPNGGGSFVYGWNSKLATEGAVGLFVDKPNFNPLVNAALAITGGSIRGALKRGAGSGDRATDFAPMLFINVRGVSVGAPPGTPVDVSDVGYLLGLEDGDPHRIVLRKGSPRGGLVVSPGDASILRTSSESFNLNTWLHLRLDSIYNLNGDVVLKCFRNDLAVNAVTAPDWQPIPGMADFIDDTLGIASGSTPLASGFAGFAFFTKNLLCRGFVDHVELLRQL
jgi:hypothetical protein